MFNGGSYGSSHSLSSFKLQVLFSLIILQIQTATAENPSIMEQAAPTIGTATQNYQAGSLAKVTQEYQAAKEKLANATGAEKEKAQKEEEKARKKLEETYQQYKDFSKSTESANNVLEKLKQDGSNSPVKLAEDALERSARQAGKEISEPLRKLADDYIGGGDSAKLNEKNQYPFKDIHTGEKFSSSLNYQDKVIRGDKNIPFDELQTTAGQKTDGRINSENQYVFKGEDGSVSVYDGKSLTEVQKPKFEHIEVADTSISVDNANPTSQSSSTDNPTTPNLAEPELGPSSNDPNEFNKAYNSPKAETESVTRKLNDASSNPVSDLAKSIFAPSETSTKLQTDAYKTMGDYFSHPEMTLADYPAPPKGYGPQQWRREANQAFTVGGQGLTTAQEFAQAQRILIAHRDAYAAAPPTPQNIAAVHYFNSELTSLRLANLGFSFTSN